jgi:uncharacterized protein (DUF169 family)
MTQELMKVKMNFAEMSEILKTSLKMKGSPVAIGFATTKDDIPPGIPELDKTIKHCMMVSLARNEGRIFYSTTEKHECMGGAYALGFKDLTPTLKTGQFYFKLGKFESVTSSKRTMESVPHLPIGETYATTIRPPGNNYYYQSMVYAEAGAIFVIPAGRAGTCLVLWYPVGLFGCCRTDSSYRKAELFSWL